jgi:hypothetical protein
VENASFYSSKSIGCKPPQTPDIGAFVREQIVARAHLENPITIFLPDGSQGRVWLASKDGKKFIGDERHWRLNIAEAGRIDRLATARERKAWPVDVMGGQRMGKIDRYLRYGILTVEHRLVDDRPKALPLQGDDHALTYDANGYPELPHCLDRRTKPSLADAA